MSNSSLLGAGLFTGVMVILTLYFERRFALASFERLTTSHMEENERRIDRWRAIGGKSLASIGFLTYFGLVCSVSESGAHEVYQLGLWGALISSALGDVLLTGRREVHFLLGLIAFFVAHIAYTIAFLQPLISTAGLMGSLLWELGALLILTFGVSGIAYRTFHADIPPSLQRPAIAYTAVIAIMVAAALLHAITLGCSIIAVGAIAFWLSDLAVAKQQFQADRLSHRGLYVRYWGLPLYYGAQLMLSSEALVL